jgi:hypothetical protein
VLITSSLENLNRSSVLVLLDPVDFSRISGFNHLIYFVPAEEGTELQKSRELFKKLRSNPAVELLHSTSLPG